MWRETWRDDVMLEMITITSWFTLFLILLTKTQDNIMEMIQGSLKCLVLCLAENQRAKEEESSHLWRQGRQERGFLPILFFKHLILIIHRSIRWWNSSIIDTFFPLNLLNVVLRESTRRLSQVDMLLSASTRRRERLWSVSLFFFCHHTETNQCFHPGTCVNHLCDHSFILSYSIGVLIRKVLHSSNNSVSIGTGTTRASPASDCTAEKTQNGGHQDGVCELQRSRRQREPSEVSY